MLEEIEMPQALDLGVVHRMYAGYPGRRKPRPGDEIYTDRQGLLGRVEIDPVHVPRLDDPQCRFKEFVLHAHTLAEPLPAPSMASRRSALKDASRRCAVADGHP